MADSLDCFQIEGVLIDFFCGSGENDANGTRILRGKIACLEIRLIPQFRHSLSDTFFRFFADGWIILQVLDTVEGETPASAATSLIVTAIKITSVCFVVLIFLFYTFRYHRFFIYFYFTAKKTTLQCICMKYCANARMRKHRESAQKQ